MGQTPGETRRLTLREASDRTGIPLDALRKRVYRGTLPAEKADGAYTILETDLAAIVNPEQRANFAHEPGETLGETGPKTAGEKKGQRMAVEAGEAVLLVDGGSRLEVVHYDRPD